MPRRALRPETPPQATVIVVTHDSARWIHDCLTAIFSQRYPPGFEVLVVDSGSSDKTPEIVERSFPRAKLIRSENRGFGAANNLGVKHAKTEFVAFANPDTVAEKDWLLQLLKPLEAARTITTSQILLISDPGKINTIGLDLHFMGFSFVRGYQSPPLDAEPEEVPGFSGASFALRRADFRSLGGFDESIFLYGEDVELSWRARHTGFRILGVPSSRIHHNYVYRMDAPKLYQLERTRQWILRKHLRSWQRIMYAGSRLVARLLVNGFARRFGSAGRDAVKRARRDAHALPPTPRTGASLHTFARRTVPFRTAFPSSRAGRWLGFIPNLFFVLNGPWGRMRGRWLHVPR